MKLSLICGGYPPDLDGIGDYSWWLGKTLAGHNDIEKPLRVFTRNGPSAPLTEGVEVITFYDPQKPQTFYDLLRFFVADTTVREPPSSGPVTDWLILQYNPFSFGPRGFCPWVPWTLSRIKKARRTRVAVMFHETYVPNWPWKFALMFGWQWPIFRAVCQVADVAFVSTERWTPQVHRAAPSLAVHHLPVGSNIPLSETSRLEARRIAGLESDALVLGVFGGAHPSRRLDWIASAVCEAARRNMRRRVVLLYVGAQGEMIRQACPQVDMIDAGKLPAEEVGLRFRSMDAVISPFLDGMSTRRTSVISVLQNGVPVATTRSKWTDEIFLSKSLSGLLVSSAASAEEFAIETINWLEQVVVRGVPNAEVTAFYDRYFAWDHVAALLVKTLKLM